MTVSAAPTALYLGTLPVTPNNRNQLATWLDEVTTEVNALIAGTGITGSITLGAASASPTGLNHITFTNLDSTVTADWGITQAWFTTGLARNDTMLFVGYNFSTNAARSDQAEPAWGIQLESYDVSGDLVTPLLAGHLTMITEDDTVVRPWSASVNRLTNESDLAFTNRYFIVNDQDSHTLLHCAYGSSATVGIGTIANSNTNLHLKGKWLLESATGSANNKYWDIDYGAGDSYIFRAVNDAYGAASAIFTVTRSGTTLTRFAFGTIKVSATLTDYANNAAAISGGLSTGDLYRTAGAVMVVTA